MARPGYGSLDGTPCDVAWWQRMEEELRARPRSRRSGKFTRELEHDFLGFFGAGSAIYVSRCSREADESEAEGVRRQLIALRLHGLDVAERPVYLDCQATTPLDPRVVTAIVEAFDVVREPTRTSARYTGERRQTPLTWLGAGWPDS